jgi:ribosome recycling factor
MADDPVSEAQNRMMKAVEAAQRELDTIRTGRASTRLVENLKVDYYGQPTPLQQVAGIAAPDARMLTIQPWDRSIVGAIEKAIQTSDLGMNPTNDGSVIRLAFPPLTEDRRKEMVKLVHKKTEDARVAIRNIRRDVHDALRKQQQSHDISEDEGRRSQERLQKVTDEFIHKVDALGKSKETEVLEV